MLTNQSDNTVGRDLAGRDNVTYNFNSNLSATSPFARLYQNLRDSNAADPRLAEMSDALRHYTSQTSDVRGLADKLTASDRIDLIEIAQQLKQAAAMKIMRWQTSAITQEIL